MKGKRFKGIVIVALTVVIGLCVCGKDKVNVENTSGYEQMESTTGEGVYDSSSDGARESSGDADAETIETAKTEESAEAVKESSESTKESVTPSKEETKPSKEQESSTPFKAQENTQQTTGKEKTKPSQEAPKPSVSAPSAEQTTPSVERPKPSAPQVHTCDYGSGTVTKEATCKEEGVRTFTCSCGASKTESIAKTGHNYVTDSKAATCTEAGYEKTACSSCGDVKSESTTPATGHSMEEHWFPSGPTCVTDGGMHFEKCTKCGVTNDLPPGQPLGHSPDAGALLRESDCITPSLYEHHCTRCGCWLSQTEGPTDPNKHDWAFDNEEQIEYCTGCGITR